MKRPPSTVYRLQLAGLLLAALALRLWLAPSRGHVHDITQLKAWSYAAATQNPLQIYSNSTANYPPLAILPLAGLGAIYRALSPSFDTSSDHFTALIKLPAIAADLLTVAVIFFWVRKRTGQRPALFCAAAYAFNPAVWYTSAWWGQLEALYTLPMLLAVITLDTGRPAPAWAWLAVGILVKPHAAVIAPVLLLGTFLPRRHRVFLQGAESKRILCEPDLSPRALRLCGKKIYSLWAAAAVFLVVLAPLAWAGQLPALWSQLWASAGRQHFLTMNAHNLWYLLTLGQGSFAAREGTPILDNQALWGPFTGWQIGLGLWAGWCALVCWAYWRGRRSASPLPWNYLAPAALVLGFYLLPAESHERYLFPALALLVPTLPNWRAGRWLYLILSLTLLANLLWVDPAVPLPGFAEQLGWGVPIALLNTAALVWVARMLGHSLRGR